MPDVTANAALLISRYEGRASGRAIRNMLATVQALMADPLDDLNLDIETATGNGLDLIGARLGFARPPITDTGIRLFGFAPEDESFGQGAFATSKRGESANLPLGPMSDANYRRMLKARGVFVRANADREHVELALARAFGEANVRVTEQAQLSRTQSVSLIGMTNVNGELRGITAAGQRYIVNPFTGAYERVAGDLASRVYSSLAFSEGDLFAVSGNQYYPVNWNANTLGAAVAMTPLDASSGVSGPVEVNGVQYVCTPTHLYSIDTDTSGSTTSIGAFAPATDIRGLATSATTLYACDAAGAIRTVDVTDASTTIYRSTGSTALVSLAYSQGALYAASQTGLAVVDTDILSVAPSFSAEVGHGNAFFLESFKLHARRLVPNNAGVGFTLRTHVRD